MRFYELLRVQCVLTFFLVLYKSNRLLFTISLKKVKDQILTIIGLVPVPCIPPLILLRNLIPSKTIIPPLNFGPFRPLNTFLILTQPQLSILVLKHLLKGLIILKFVGLL